MRKILLGSAAVLSGGVAILGYGYENQLKFEDTVRAEIVQRLKHPLMPYTKEQPIAADVRFISLRTLNVTVPIETHGPADNPNYPNDYCLLLNDPRVPGRLNRIPICASYSPK